MSTGDALIDAQQWLIDLMAYDMGRLVTGLIGLIIVIEFLVRFREWIKS